MEAQTLGADPTPIPDTTPLMQVKGLQRSFYGVRALTDASFDVAQGTITALIGPNGAGKTTAYNSNS